MRLTIALFLLFSSFSNLTVFAQDDEIFNGIVVMYSEQKYEKCLKKAISFTEKESTRKHPLPYLYVSMCYYEMSKDQNFQEDYPKAFKDALSFGARYRKKDKESRYYDKYTDYFTRLKKDCLEQVENHLLDIEKLTNVKRAKGIIRKLVTIDPTDVGALYLNGMCNQKLKIKRDATESFKKADALLQSMDVVEFKEKSRVERRLLMIGLMKTAEMWKSFKSHDKSVSAINKGYVFFKEDMDLETFEEYRESYNAIVNKI